MLNQKNPKMLAEAALFMSPTPISLDQDYDVGDEIFVPTEKGLSE